MKNNIMFAGRFSLRVEGLEKFRVCLKHLSFFVKVISYSKAVRDERTRNEGK